MILEFQVSDYYIVCIYLLGGIFMTISMVVFCLSALVFVYRGSK